ncbi:YbaB/EbfC family nucleoid-associated protein [Nocardia vinacea]|uniref:YbaB/EbfC family nucleoid-associated protein n=1 Tax=Nocardia vinacea TaxID=96468 RepID=UPI002E15E0A7|nr:YbaB/EbfC family nucleoid-associated protein [Nocardia vinacea]
MRNRRARDELAEMLEAVRGRMAGISDFEQQRLALTATATALDGAVSVTVDANGRLVETSFADDVRGMAPDKLGPAVTAAAQAAADDLVRQTEELRAPLLREREKLPTMSDLIAGLPDIGAELPGRSRVSAAAEPTDDQQAMVPPARPVSEVFADSGEESVPVQMPDVEDPDEVRRAGSGSEVSDSGWG